MASTVGVSSSLILEVLNRNNYEKWRLRVKTYLLAEDLWEVVEAITEPANLEDDGAEYKSWRKKNAKALYVIQNSCGPEMFNFISQTEMAKSAWEALEKISRLTGHVENSAENFGPYIPFTEFVSEGDWDKAKECLKLKELDLHSAVRAIDPRDGCGDTAIHVAAWNGHVNIVKELVLLMTQEDLKMKNAEGNTALHVAAWNGQLHIVKELVLLMGEEINSDGSTALHLAAYNEKVDIVKELVRFMRPKDLKIKDSYGYTALHLAVKKGNVPIVKDLAELVGEVRGPDGDTALHIAVKMGATKIVKELVSLMRREDLSIKNDEGYTAFQLAVKKGNVPTMKEFMTKEKERNFNSYTQFITYVANGDWDNAKECLNDDPCDAITLVDPRDGYGDTALHVAARKGHVHIVKEWISLLKVRKENLQLKTVEDFATFGSSINLGVTEEVLMERAKDMVEQYEKTPTAILDVQNAQGSTALHIAVSEGNLDIVRELVPLMREEDLEIKDVEGFTALHNAVEKGYIDIVKELVPIMRQEGLELKTAKGNNALHLAVRFGHINIAKEVMSFMRKEALEEKDGEGYTALRCALEVRKDEDVMEIAKYMAENNNKVFGINVASGTIPVVACFGKGKSHLCPYLYSVTPLEYLMPERGEDGARLIVRCFRGKKFDIALDLLRRCPRLAISPTGFESCCPIMELAGMHSAFLSGTQLGFGQYLIYNLITLYKELAHSLLKLLGVSRLRKVKWIHTRSIDVLCCISEMLKNDNPTSAQLDIIRKSIFKAVEYGHVEFVTHICEAHPPFVKKREGNKNIFQFAVECRQHKIYSLIHRLDREDQRFFGTCATKFPENMLHLAGKLSPLSRFNHISGAALQMQRELQWFKEVGDFVPEALHEWNSDGMTPHELFTKNHEKLKEEAEVSMKGTATSCTVVGALIVTIMFAAAFTVPGGNNGNTGYPMFLAKKLFLVFIISDTLSLVSSTTSVILFLGILTSRYAENDFLKNLPTKMMIGLVTLFLSIGTMMIAFSSALIIMLNEEYSWAIVPCIFVASIPVASFIWLQFPFLIEIFWSTYGPGIFDKKAKPWIKL
ncbi:uncharacterized protein LOC133707372 isoform X2 [Rosa rugosa]|uniref:uncharacterized protein LOC133707372 isoform X2 n=1 Tax=Rosa rugosa TaxID=74645 RepID=UPI002B4058FA|nr:uncharacterized protein LOC133707372 isoform X2 [Rosa rugosa]